MCLQGQRLKQMSPWQGCPGVSCLDAKSGEAVATPTTPPWALALDRTSHWVDGRSPRLRCPLCGPLSAFLLSKRKEEAISQRSPWGFLWGQRCTYLGKNKIIGLLLGVRNETPRNKLMSQIVGMALPPHEPRDCPCALPGEEAELVRSGAGTRAGLKSSA